MDVALLVKADVWAPGKAQTLFEVLQEQLEAERARAEGGGGDGNNPGGRGGIGGDGAYGEGPPGGDDEENSSPSPVMIKVLWIGGANEPYDLNAPETGKASNISAQITVPSDQGRLLIGYTKPYTPERTDTGKVVANINCMKILEDAEWMTSHIRDGQVFSLQNQLPPHKPQMVMAIPTDATGVISDSEAVGYWQKKIEQLTIYKPIIWVPKDTIWRPQEFGLMLRACDRDGFPEHFELFTTEPPAEAQAENLVFHEPCYSVTKAIQHVLDQALQPR